MYSIALNNFRLLIKNLLIIILNVFSKFYIFLKLHKETYSNHLFSHTGVYWFSVWGFSKLEDNEKYLALSLIYTLAALPYISYSSMYLYSVALLIFNRFANLTPVISSSFHLLYYFLKSLGKVLQGLPNLTPLALSIS